MAFSFLQPDRRFRPAGQIDWSMLGRSIGSNFSGQIQPTMPSWFPRVSPQIRRDIQDWTMQSIDIPARPADPPQAFIPFIGYSGEEALIKFGLSCDQWTNLKSNIMSFSKENTVYSSHDNSYGTMTKEQYVMRLNTEGGFIWSWEYEPTIGWYKFSKGGIGWQVGVVDSFCAKTR